MPFNFVPTQEPLAPRLPFHPDETSKERFLLYTRDFCRLAERGINAMAKGDNRFAAACVEKTARAGAVEIIRRNGDARFVVGQFDVLSDAQKHYNASLDVPGFTSIYALALNKEGCDIEARAVLADFTSLHEPVRPSFISKGERRTGRVIFECTDAACQITPESSYSAMRKIWTDMDRRPDDELKAFVLRRYAVCGVRAGDAETAMACFLRARMMPVVKQQDPIFANVLWG